MIKNDKQQGTPFVDYTDTKANIEALTGVRFGAHAVATNNPTAPLGLYTGAGWHWYTTGSAGGASLAFQDEGIPLGTPGTVNFVGANVEVTISGTVARVFVIGTSGSSGREVLSAARTYYVRTDGSDSNNGLANTAGGAFLTINKAIAVAASLDLSAYGVTLQVASGTYTGEILPLSYVGAGPITLIGDETTPSNVVLNSSVNCLTMYGVLGKYRIRGFKVTPPASYYGFDVQNGSYLEYQNINFAGNTSSFAHMVCRNASIVSTGNSTISAGSTAHIVTSDNGWTNMRGMTLTLTGTPSFVNYFAFSTRGGVLLIDTFTPSGSATGKKYDVTLNGVIQAAGSTLPGDTAGTTSTGGQYL